MKLFLLNLIALIMAVSALHITVDPDISTASGNDTYQSAPLLSADTLSLHQFKRIHEVEINISHVFQNIISRIELDLEIQSFFFYLPIYSLVRAKEYFLLI